MIQLTTNHSFLLGSFQLLYFLGYFFVFFLVALELFDFEGVLIDELGMFLLVGKNVFVDLLNFLLEVVDFPPDHGQFLLDTVLVVGVDEFLIFFPNFLETGQIVDESVSLL